MNKKHKVEPEKWIDKYGDLLFKYALYRLSDPDIAEDIVQEALVAALKGIDKFKGESQESTWLVSILKHKIADYYRSVKKKGSETEYDSVISQKPEVNDEGTHTENLSEPWSTDPWKALEQMEFMKTLDRCMLELSDKQYDVFSMRELDELSTAEVCKKLNISESNFWVIIHRARGRLKKCLKDNWLGK